MRLIHKIEIKNYRSIKSDSLSEIKDLNIISGGNDVGKSNVLRALDAFFNEKNINFQEEFNFLRKQEIRRQREKQIISVKVWFNNNTYKNLPLKFYVKKTWDKTGKIINTQDNIDGWLKKQKSVSEKNAKTSLSRYLNRIKFRYIPAIKDNECFSTLLIDLYNAIAENSSTEEFENTFSSFNNKLGELSQILSDRFLEISGIKSAVNIPTNVSELARRLSVSTYAGNDNSVLIPLFNRGDGIRMQYIPSILNFISMVEQNKWHIWAIDEPETSCEYAKTARLAKDFQDIYSLNNQIFLSSHSFHFINLQNENVSRYRVTNKDNSSSICYMNDLFFENDELKSELGVFSLLEGLQEVYDKYHADTIALQSNKELLDRVSKTLLLFEGESDRILFKKAFKSLYPNEMDNFCFSDEATQNGSAVGEGATNLYGFLTSHIPKIAPFTKKIIVIFDHDDAGKKEFNKIKNKFTSLYKLKKSNGVDFLKHDKHIVFTFCLIPPSFRKDFIHCKPKHCYLSTELLLPDDLIPASNREEVPHTTPPIFSFKSKNKVNFASQISEDADYSGFKETIDFIIYLNNVK